VSLCRVSLGRHALSPSPGAMTATFFCRVSSGTWQSLCRVPDRKYSVKKSLPMYNSLSLLFHLVFSRLVSGSECLLARKKMLIDGE
jgi:hypothetical protein